MQSRLQIITTFTNEFDLQNEQNLKQRQSFRSNLNQTTQNREYDQNSDSYHEFQKHNFRKEYQQWSQRVYQISVVDENTSDDIINLEKKFYHDEDMHSENDVYDNSYDEFYESEKAYDGQNVNFVAMIERNILEHICATCKDSFTSKTKLFKHLRKTHWSNKDSLVEKLVLIMINDVLLNDTHQIIQSSVRSDESYEDIDYAFQEVHYATVKTSFDNDVFHDVCIDFDNSIIMIDRKFLLNSILNLQIQTMKFSISIRNVSNKLINTNEFAIVRIHLNELANEKLAITVLIIEVHLVDQLNVNMLVEMNVISSEHIILNLHHQWMIIESCQNLMININSKARLYSNTRRIIQAQKSINLSSELTTSVLVFFNERSLSDDRDFLFESQYSWDLKYDDDVFAHVVNIDLSFVQIRNATKSSITLSRKIKLDFVIKYNITQECYMIMSSDANLTACEWMNWNEEKVRRNRVNKSVIMMIITHIVAFNAIFEIDLKLEIILFNDVTIYEFNSLKLVNLIDEYQDLFKDKDMIVAIFKKEWMSIILKSNAILKLTRIYFVERKKREIIDFTLNKLHEKSKMRFSIQLINFNSSVFVIWRNLSDDTCKERMIINLRDLNEMIKINSYSMKQQSEIIAVIAKYSHIFIVDAINYCHQFLVHRSNHFKFIIVSYREQEKFNVILMKYKRSFSYVQRQTDAMLRSYWKFIRAYIDDIIIFSLILKNHLQHLQDVFDLFRAWRVSLISNKSFLSYSLIILLDQRVNSLRMFTFKNKIKVIISLQFSDNLRNLETFLNLIEWLCFLISWYAQRAWFLQERKTILFKEVSNIKDSKVI